MGVMQNQIKTILDWLGVGSINIFGRPFAGKDTQGRVLADLLGAKLIAGGDILRSYHDQDEINRVMAEGGLIPSDLYLKIMLPYLSKSEFEGKPLILSAMGRLKGEESVIMEATSKSGHPIKAVVLLEMDDGEVWRRFEIAKLERDRGERTDDQLEVLKNRLAKFQNMTIPVIDFYEAQNLLVRVDGTLSREGVTSEIIKSLNQFTGTNS